MNILEVCVCLQVNNMCVFMTVSSKALLRWIVDKQQAGQRASGREESKSRKVVISLMTAPSQQMLPSLCTESSLYFIF